MDIPRLFGANVRRQINRQAADHGVAGLYVCYVEMLLLPVNSKALLLRPNNGAGVAGDEVGGHGCLHLSHSKNLTLLVSVL